MREYRTVKLWKSTWKLINVARAETEETLVEFVHRLVEEEMTRIGFRRARRRGKDARSCNNESVRRK